MFIQVYPFIRNLRIVPASTKDQESWPPDASKFASTIKIQFHKKFWTSAGLYHNNIGQEALSAQKAQLTPLWVCVVSWELPGQSKWFSGAAVIKFNGSASGALLLNLAMLIEFQVTILFLVNNFENQERRAKFKSYRLNGDQ